MSITKEVCLKKIMQVENERVVHNYKEVVETKNKYFTNITKTLRPRPSKKYDTDDIDLLTSQDKYQVNIQIQHCLKNLRNWKSALDKN